MKIHIDMNCYFSNSFIAMNSDNFYDIDPFLHEDGKLDERGLGDWHLFIKRVALWLKNYEYKKVHIAKSHRFLISNPRSVLVSGRSKDETTDIEILLTPKIADRHYADDDKCCIEIHGRLFDKVALADIIMESKDLGILELHRSFSEAIRSLRLIIET